MSKHNDFEHVSRVVLHCGIIFTKLIVGHSIYQFLNYNDFIVDALCHAVTLTFGPLTLSVM